MSNSSLQKILQANLQTQAWKIAVSFRVFVFAASETRLFYFLCELDFFNHSTPHLQWKGLWLGLRLGTTLKICESWNYTVLKFTPKSAMRSWI